jgi:hypothetical protein
MAETNTIEEVIVTASALPNITAQELERLREILTARAARTVDAGGGRVGGGSIISEQDQADNEFLKDITARIKEQQAADTEEEDSPLLDIFDNEDIKDVEDLRDYVQVASTPNESASADAYNETQQTLLDLLEAAIEEEVGSLIGNDTSKTVDIRDVIEADTTEPEPLPQPVFVSPIKKPTTTAETTDPVLPDESGGFGTGDLDIFQDTTDDIEIPTDLGYGDIIDAGLDGIDLPRIILNPDAETPIEVVEDTGDVEVGLPPLPPEGTGEGDGTGEGAGDGEGDGTGDGTGDGEGAGDGSGTGDGTGSGGGPAEGGIPEYDEESDDGIDFPILRDGNDNGTGEGDAGFGNDGEDEDSIDIIINPAVETVNDSTGTESGGGGGGGGGSGMFSIGGASKSLDPTQFMASISFAPQLLTPYMPKTSTDYLAELLARLQK